jgi:hypothetical protein
MSMCLNRQGTRLANALQVNPFPTGVPDQGHGQKPFLGAFAAHSKPSAGTLGGVTTHPRPHQALAS